jgi:hypothetical protein
VFPSDTSDAGHGTGAAFYLVGSALALIALAYAVRPRSELLGTAVVLLGLVGAAATTFFLTGVEVLAEGATERSAAYVLPIALAVAGIALWRLGARSPEVPEEERLSRREERDQRRALAAERARERDEALETAARRSDGSRPGDDPDAEDPWISRT